LRVTEIATYKDGLSDSSSTEESDLSSSSVRSEEVDNLDSGLKDLGGGGLVDERRGVGVNGGLGDSDDG
jgi:hypothetical protein